MKQICDYIKCTGCQVCFDSCSHGAITLKADLEGFLRPNIDQEKCVNCGLCVKNCPVNNTQPFKYPSKAFSGWIKDDKIRAESSSGGAFSALAIPILQRGGVVFGAQLDDCFNVTHVYIEKIEDLYKLRGSKYVQSKTAGSFRLVREKLKANKNVLFSGTPCQIAALRNFLKIDYPNLITVDIVCHGVPSPLIFEEWKTWFKKENKLSKLDSIHFRRKEKSWIFYNMEIVGEKFNGQKFKYIGKYQKDPWIRGFLSDKFLRSSCHTCAFSNIKRISDFTIADWWGYVGSPDESNDYEEKGVSMILCNTSKAVDYFYSEVKGNMYVRERDIEDARMTSPPLSHPISAPNNRADFWNDFRRYPFDYVVKTHMHKKRLLLRDIILLNLKPSSLRNNIFRIYYKFRSLRRLLKF